MRARADTDDLAGFDAFVVGMRPGRFATPPSLRSFSRWYAALLSELQKVDAIDSDARRRLMPPPEFERPLEQREVELWMRVCTECGALGGAPR